MESFNNLLATDPGLAAAAADVVNAIGSSSRSLILADSVCLNSTISAAKTSGLFLLEMPPQGLDSDLSSARNGFNLSDLNASALSFGSAGTKLGVNALRLLFATCGVSELLGYGSLPAPLMSNTVGVAKSVGALYHAAAIYQAKGLMGEWDKAKTPDELKDLFGERLGTNEGDPQLRLLKEKTLEYTVGSKVLSLIREGHSLFQRGDDLSNKLALAKLAQAKEQASEYVYQNKFNIGFETNILAGLGLVAAFPEAAPIAALMFVARSGVGLWLTRRGEKVAEERFEEISATGYFNAVAQIEGKAQIAPDEYTYFEALSTPLMIHSDKALDSDEINALASHRIRNESLGIHMGVNGTIVDREDQVIGQVITTKDAAHQTVLIEVVQSQDQVTLTIDE